MSVQTKLLTVDEFWRLYGDHFDEVIDGVRPNYELINGEAVDVPMPGLEHGEIQMMLGAQLLAFVVPKKLGKVYSEVHSELAKDTLRVPDIAFISSAKVKLITDRKKFVPFAPDLAVEIISPSNTATEMEQKIALFFSAGTRLVWLVYPDMKKVTVRRPDGTAYDVPFTGTLDGGDVLPDLAIPVSSIFPEEPAAQSAQE